MDTLSFLVGFIVGVGSIILLLIVVTIAFYLFLKYIDTI